MKKDPNYLALEKKSAALNITKNRLTKQLAEIRDAPAKSEGSAGESDVKKSEIGQRLTTVENEMRTVRYKEGEMIKSYTAHKL